MILTEGRNISAEKDPGASINNEESGVWGGGLWRPICPSFNGVLPCSCAPQSPFKITDIYSTTSRLSDINHVNTRQHTPVSPY
jgi:hypothetical protein